MGNKIVEKTFQIRNSTVDFLVFTKQNSQDGIEVRVQDENVWLTQEGIARLFDKSRNTITEHLQNIFKEGELEEEAVCRKFRHTASDGKNYSVNYYNLDAVISVGYRANSVRATEFRRNVNYSIVRIVKSTDINSSPEYQFNLALLFPLSLPQNRILES